MWANPVIEPHDRVTFKAWLCGRRSRVHCCLLQSNCDLSILDACEMAWSATTGDSEIFIINKMLQ